VSIQYLSRGGSTPATTENESWLVSDCRWTSMNKIAGTTPTISRCTVFGKRVVLASARRDRNADIRRSCVFGSWSASSVEASKERPGPKTDSFLGMRKCHRRCVSADDWRPVTLQRVSLGLETSRCALLAQPGSTNQKFQAVGSFAGLRSPLYQGRGSCQFSCRRCSAVWPLQHCPRDGGRAARSGAARHRTIRVFAR
jgi:hypothetical protein